MRRINKGFFLKRLRVVIAPPATPLQDFTYHWKQLMNFYANHLTDCKVPIYTTGIPRHLDKLLEILLQEEKDEAEPGPCLEYLLQHKLLDLLTTLASAETPPGMRTICLSFLRKFLGRSKHPLLHHVSVYYPVQKLICLCNGNQASPHETEEVQFLLTICYLVCKYPYVISIINESPTNHGTTSQAKVDKSTEVPQVERVTYDTTRQRTKSNPLFEPLDAQAVTLISPLSNLRPKSAKLEHRLPNKVDDKSSNSPSTSSQSSSPSTNKPSDQTTGESQHKIDMEEMKLSENPTSMQEMDTHLRNLKELHLNENTPVISRKSSVSENPEQSLLRSSPEPESKCLLLDALISYFNSADNTIRVRACEGVMALTSTEDPSFAQTIANSKMATIISERLEYLFNVIPAHVDPIEIDGIDVTWGLDSPLWTNESKFPGCRQVAAFFMWFDFCNQLIREAHLDIAEAISKSIRVNFLEKIVTPALSDHHVVLITALTTKCLKEITSTTLCNEVSYWLVGQHRDPDLPNVWSSPVLHKLIENCYTDSDDLTVETLKLFEEMIEKRNEHILYCLVLMYLSSRGYYDNTAADSAIASWSDEEDEREKEREKKNYFDLSYEQSHSRTLAPSNIHRIVNCFLSLVPRSLQTDLDINNYESYMADWERQYTVVLADCSLMAWPLEAVSVDDSASSDSRPEADHCATRFYIGPFLTMLLDKLSNIPKQKYDINLQLTVVLSRLALLPHPYLHEYMLNPLLPLAPGTKSLFICLQRVVKQLVNEVSKIEGYKPLLKETRERLLDDTPNTEEKQNILLESVIITEEFCKGLAAIAYVKYHHSM
ncbi:FHF complex subunit HOOK interacting protein 2A-like isoform X1 [Prorops nasuta]|uniref:FHF complex subunit HOOK interacting protein 2A-like isoform X1 n=2 Tax=Prorops nasuta TaxID=863751 RepID=UPI0034CF57ED